MTPCWRASRRQTPHASRARSGGCITFRGPETPSGMFGQVGRGFAGDTAGRRYRHPPIAVGKAATHPASKHCALEECRSPLAHCCIPGPMRKLRSRKFCSFVPPRCWFAPPRHVLRSVCLGGQQKLFQAASASGFTSRLASWVSSASARFSSSRLRCNIFCSSRRSNWPASAAAVPYAAIS